MSSSTTYPVQVLRARITAFEAAILVCLADPDHRPVHRLRTETRRVEALLLLLGLIPGLPEHREQAVKLRRALTRLRRAGGKVRDLDVHRKMLEEFAEAEAHPKAASNGQGEATPPSSTFAKRSAKASLSNSEPQETPGDAALLSDAATDLRRKMGQERDRAAVELQAILGDRQAKTSRACERFMAVLQPAADLAMTGPDLLSKAELLLNRGNLLQTSSLPTLTGDELHTIRKAAKAARYVAEVIPNDRALTLAAQAFEALQEAGGQWHDALEIAAAARRYFGKHHELTASYRKRREDKLQEYLAALERHRAESLQVPRHRRRKQPLVSG